MRQKRKGLGIAAALLTLFVLPVVIQVTTAWNMHQVEQQNNLQSRSHGANIEEVFPNHQVTPGGTNAKTVSFKNTGSGAALVRAALSERWVAGSAQLEGPTGVTLNWAPQWGTDWELKSDGWYYYKRVLPAGSDTGAVLQSVTFPAQPPSGAEYRLAFAVETLQVSDEDAVNTAAATAVFGRGVQVTGKTISNGAVTGGTVTWS